MEDNLLTPMELFKSAHRDIYDGLIYANELIDVLGIEECDKCKFGGTYCVECKFLDAHEVLKAIRNLLSER